MARFRPKAVPVRAFVPSCLRACPPALGLILALLLAGCSNLRVTDPKRTATEQYLMSVAAMKAIEQLSFDALRGRQVFIDTQYLASEEQAFLLGEMRARCLEHGLQLVPRRDDAQVVLEVRSAAVGIDRKDFLVGLPSFVLSAGGDGSLGSTVPVLTPELAFVKNIEQKGFATVAFVAYWTATGEIVASSPSLTGQTLRDDWWFFGFGPRTVGSIPSTGHGDQ